MSKKRKEPFSEFGKRHYRAGLKQGRKEARVAGHRYALRWLLAARGFQTSDYQEGLIDGCTDPVTLQWWFEDAVTAKSADEVFG